MVQPKGPGFQTLQIEEYVVEKEPFYVPMANEIELFEAAYLQQIPVLLKGPTGCGKTRFVEHMAYRLSQPSSVRQKNGGSETNAVPLVTVACHEDLTASDLVGRYLIDADGTQWIDGPLTRAVKVGALCYLDEIVETRKDTTVLIHPLTDHRRILPIEKQGLLLEASEGFLLVMSYNPGYQSALKDLKHSTRQRFISIEFDYPVAEVEAKILENEAGISPDVAMGLAKLGEKVRNLKDHGLQEGSSTRLLIYAGKLISQGVPAREACQVSIVWALSDDVQVQRSMEEVISSIFE